MSIFTSLVQSASNPALVIGFVAMSAVLFVLYKIGQKQWVYAFLAGAVYSFSLEGFAHFLHASARVELFQGYLTGITISMIALVLWLALTQKVHRQHSQSHSHAWSTET